MSDNFEIFTTVQWWLLWEIFEKFSTIFAYYSVDKTVSRYLERFSHLRQNKLSLQYRTYRTKDMAVKYVAEI